MNKDSQINLDSKKISVLLAQVFIVSVCSLLYELVLGTTISNLTGNPTFAYSIVIGLFLAGLGLGAFATKWVGDGQEQNIFVWVETSLALVGGLSVILVYYGFIYTPFFPFFYIILPLSIGMLSGFEIPLLTRVLNRHATNKFKYTISNILSFDYLGGLAASLLFPFVLLPYLGLVQLSILTGLVNTAMAFLAIYVFYKILSRPVLKSIIALGVLITLSVIYIFSSNIYNFLESGFYFDPIIYSSQSQYQRIVVTKNGTDTRLYLNGGIQFSTLDEYRYHEALVIPAMSGLLPCSDCQLKIAVFGGGDGLVIRQLLKFSDNISKIYLVDIDGEVTNLFKQTPFFQSLNGDSLNSDKVQIINEDAWSWLRSQNYDSFDLIISDLPDPQESTIARLYTKEFYTDAKLRLKENGVFVTQASSVIDTKMAFWGINQTMGAVFDSQNITPYSVYVPSFGLWGFQVVGKNERVEFDDSLIDNIATQYLDSKTLENSTSLGKDVYEIKDKSGAIIKIDDLEVNTLDRLILTIYYNQGTR